MFFQLDFGALLAVLQRICAHSPNLTSASYVNEKRKEEEAELEEVLLQFNLALDNAYDTSELQLALLGEAADFVTLCLLSGWSYQEISKNSTITRCAPYLRGCNLTNAILCRIAYRHIYCTSADTCIGNTPAIKALVHSLFGGH